MPQETTAPPAGGAALDQVLIATGMGVAVTVAVLVLCAGHRSGRLGLLAFGDRVSTRFFGLPGWAGVPSGLALLVLPTTLFGLQWDESLHIGQGRDEGPLANPSHFFLLAGIFTAFAAGVIGCAMADDRVPRSGVRVRDGWRAPLGAVLTAVGAGVALLGFPLDDVWHRLFGQDVTLWSPTHVTMVAGMALSVVGLMVLNVEGMRARSGWQRGGLSSLAHQVQRFMLPAALLLVLSLLQGEFDFGVPQFALVFHPMTVMLAAGLGLVAARMFMGPGAALGGALLFVAIRGVIVLLVGPVLGEPIHAFPLYVVEALIVEAVALRAGIGRPLRFALICGALIGTVGLAAEWAWSSVFAIAWPAELMPEGLVFGLAMALAGAVLGAWMGVHLRVRGWTGARGLRRGAVVSAVAVTAAIGFWLAEPAPDPVQASVTLTEAAPPPARTVNATVRVEPAAAADDAVWLRTIAWQGGGLQGADLERVGPGVYRTSEPVPVHGDWKTAIRLHSGRTLTGLPIYLPADDAIPVAGLAATPAFERAFADEGVVLRREAKDVDGWLWTAGTLAVALAMFALLASWAAALHRLSVTAPERRPTAAARGSARPSRPGVLAGT